MDCLSVRAVLVLATTFSSGCGLLLSPGGEGGGGARDGGTGDGALGVDGSSSDGAGSDPDGAASDASIDAGPGATACGTVGSIQEGFASDPTTMGWFVSGPGVALVVDGQLSIPLPSNYMGVTYGGFAAGFETAFRDDSVSVRVIEVPTTSDTFLALRHDQSHALTFLVAGGSLEASISDGVRDPSPVRVPYDTTVHRYWRLREAAGTTHWETSQDGVMWDAPIRTASTPWFADDVIVEVGSLLDTPEPAPGRAVFDDLNVGRALVPMCAPSSLRASPLALAPEGDFREGGAPGCAMQSGSVLRLTPPPGGQCFVVTDPGFDFRGGESVTVDLDVPFPDAPIQVVWRIAGVHEDYARVLYRGGQLALLGSGAPAMVSGSPGTRWRLRPEGARIHLDVDPGSGTFDHRMTVDWTPPAIAKVFFGIELLSADPRSPYIDVTAYNVP